MIDENTLGKNVFDGTEEEVINSYSYGFEVYERDRKLVPEGQLFEISYENLEADPVETLKAAYEGLGLPGFEDLEKALQPELESLSHYKKNQFNDDPYWVNRVYNELKPAFDRFGYEKPQTVTDDATKAAKEQR